MFTGCRDENIRVWDASVRPLVVVLHWQTDKCVYTIEGHFDEVSGLARYGPLVVSASLDGTIRTWELRG